MSPEPAPLPDPPSLTLNIRLQRAQDGGTRAPNPIQQF